MNFLKLASTLANHKDVIGFVKSHNLIKLQRKCSICKSRMVFKADSTMINEFRWRCKNSRCRKSRSIRANSFFDNSHLSMKQIIFIIYVWSKGYSLKLATEELEITKKRWSIGNDSVEILWFTIIKTKSRIQVKSEAFGKL